jgi:hypothetical protein
MAQCGAFDCTKSLKVKSSVAQTGNLALPSVCATKPSLAGSLQRVIVGDVDQVFRVEPEHLGNASDALCSRKSELQSFIIGLSSGHFRQHSVRCLACIPPSLKVHGQELRPLARTIWHQILGGPWTRSSGFQMRPFFDRPPPLKALKPSYPTSPVRQEAANLKIRLSEALKNVIAPTHPHA